MRHITNPRNSGDNSKFYSQFKLANSVYFCIIHILLSCAAFKDKFEKQQKRKAQLKLLYMISATKLDYDMRKNTLRYKYVNMLLGAKSIYGH